MSQILVPTLQGVPSKAYRLRWRFEFLNGKPSKVGVFDATSDLPQDSAWAVNKEGLAYAIIEGECRHTFATKRLYVCDAVDYVSMQWEAYSKSPSLGLKPEHGSFKLRPVISGLSVLTREEKITCWTDGTVTKEPLSEHDQQWKIKEHSV